LLEAAADGRRVILSLKWNLKDRKQRVPEPGGDVERAWFEWVEGLLTSCDGKLAIFTLANEPMIDTAPEDLTPGPDGVVPFARFTERLLAHVSSLGVRDSDGQPLSLYVGAFTRLQTERMQASPAVNALLALAARDDRVAGVDVHLHNRNLDEARAALAYARRQVTKPLIVTEFSLVWRHKAALKQPIGKSEEGRAFAVAHDLDPQMKVIDYMNACAAEPVDEAVWRDFLASQQWYMPDYLGKVAQIMRERGVTVSTYAFSQGTADTVESRRGRKIPADKPPYVLNFLFARLFCKPPKPGVAPVSRWVFDDYLRLQTGAAATTDSR